MAQLLLHGVPPYQLAYSMKFPGIHATYAAILALLGQSVAGIHVGLLLANIAATVLVYYIGKTAYDRRIGAYAAAGFAILSLNPEGHGLSANAEHFVLVPALGSVLLTLRAANGGRWSHFAGAGALAGLSLVVKQHGAAFAAFTIFYLAYTQIARRTVPWSAFARQMSVYLLSLAAPLAITCLALARAGVFEEFWFWTFTYAREYASVFSPAEGASQFLPAVARHVIKPSLSIWLLGMAGILALWFDRELKPPRAFTAGLLIFSLLAVVPGFYFRRHYFILVLPGIALMAALGAVWLGSLLQRYSKTKRLPGVLLFLAMALTVCRQWSLLFTATPVEASRAVYGLQPFAESIEVGDYIRRHSAPADRIAVLGSEPQILFYAQRLSATPFIYTYPLVEEHDRAVEMQKEMIREIEGAKPRYIVAVFLPQSWCAWPNAPRLIFDWAARYCGENYRQVGVVEFVSENEVYVLLGDGAESAVPHSQYYLIAYERLGAPPEARVSQSLAFPKAKRPPEQRLSSGLSGRGDRI